jgi:membrane protein YdbS with pleckstrin-like domain
VGEFFSRVWRRFVKTIAYMISAISFIFSFVFLICMIYAIYQGELFIAIFYMIFTLFVMHVNSKV